MNSATLESRQNLPSSKELTHSGDQPPDHRLQETENSTTQPGAPEAMTPSGSGTEPSSLPPIPPLLPGGESATPPSAQPPTPSDSSDPVSLETELVQPVKGPERPRAIVIFGVNIFRQKSKEISRAPLLKVMRSLVTSVAADFQASPAPSFLRRHALLLLCVVLPTFLSAIYYGLVASDVYVSEAKFVVRSPNKKSASSGLGAMLEGAGFSGFSRAQEDVYTVSEYVSSRDALTHLNEELKLSESWANNQVDLFNRFDPLGLDGSAEALYEYYRKRVKVAVDATTGITTLTSSVFSPDQAFDINRILLGAAENIVNVLNDRGRGDLIRFAEREVKTAEEKAKAAANALSNYRNTNAVVDPERQTQLHYEHISRLQEELVKTRSQLAQLKVFAPKSPHPPALELREKTLENEIQKEMEKITGGENSLASKAAEFERLALDREFAEKQLASALASLEVARNEAQRQQLYLETIAKPSLPDEATLPKRFRGILATLVLGLIAWGILGMLLAGVREHQY
jgi:capsular polysaccharide transport system permease protein